MKQLSDWGFHSASWKGERGEYWVLVQAILMLGYVLLPVYRPTWLRIEPPLLYGVWALAGVLFLLALVLIGKGLVDLGKNLTPLPYPKPEGELVQTGIYSVVRHPLYSGVTLAAKAYAIGQLSLSHFVAMLLLFVFFNFKANQEESWLSQKYPDYWEYRQRVKKLIPWVY
ncbi:MAG: methyltransferase family protein [Leptolyngbya sp. IPPAS B-1204]|nr:MAG: isoprenylcysteine carboxylmethyltransferase family protein [Leptolyngbya sp. IPPAS B-1204]